MPRPISNIKSKAHTEESEMTKDRWTEPKPPDCTAEDGRILGRHKHGRERRHVTQGGPPEDREGDFRPYGLAIEGWWRDNPRRSHLLRIKYTQLTL